MWYEQGFPCEGLGFRPELRMDGTGRLEIFCGHTSILAILMSQGRHVEQEEGNVTVAQSHTVPFPQNFISKIHFTLLRLGSFVV